MPLLLIFSMAFDAAVFRHYAALPLDAIFVILLYALWLFFSCCCRQMLQLRFSLISFIDTIDFIVDVDHAAPPYGQRRLLR